MASLLDFLLADDVLLDDDEDEPAEPEDDAEPAPRQRRLHHRVRLGRLVLEIIRT